MGREVHGNRDQVLTATASAPSGRSFNLHVRDSTPAGAAKEQQRCIDELRTQRRRWFGAQLTGFGRVDRVVHAELRSAIERLMSEKAGLANAIVDFKRTINALEYDLAARSGSPGIVEVVESDRNKKA